MLEEVVVGWWKVRWIWCMRQNYIVQSVQLLKHWLYNMGSGTVMAKNWARYVESFLDSESCRGSNGLQTTKQWLKIFLRCKVGLGKCFEASSQSHHWTGCHQLSHKIHFSLHVTIQSRNSSLLLCRIREDNTLGWWFFWFLVSSQGTHLSNFFTFPICFKCWMTVEWLMLSS